MNVWRDDVHIVMSGEAALVTDHDTSAALFLDGLLQSRLALRNPATIVAPYVRWMAALTETCGSDGAIAHIGGGLLGLERHIEAVDSGRDQVVFEISSDVVHLASNYTPRLSPNVRIINAPGEDMLSYQTDSNYGLTVIDAGAGDRVPRGLLAEDFQAGLADRSHCFSINVVNHASGDVEEIIAVVEPLYEVVSCIYAESRGGSRSLGNVVISGCNCGRAKQVQAKLSRVEIVESRAWIQRSGIRAAEVRFSENVVSDLQKARMRRDDLLASGTTTHSHPLLRWESMVVLAQLNELLDGIDPRVTLTASGA